ncbi:MAG: DUF885 domain-containing protein [Acidobacteriia bacterium]|nr:DUF885 domain-containing protein [Terriglobia bacterium]
MRAVIRVLVGVALAGSVALGAAGIARAGAVAAQDPHAAWQALADAYFDEVYFKFSPTQGTSVGFHQYDRLLEDYSRAGVDRQVAALHAFEKRVESFDPAGLSETEAADRQMVLSNIRGTLLELETIRPWEKDPDTYSSGVTVSAYAIMSREFAPAADRLRSVIAREQRMPAVFAAARANLKNSPRIYTEIAIEQLPGDIDFFRNSLPQAFAGVKDAAIQAEFQKSNAAVIAALVSYGEWLKSDLLPRSHGDFRIGAETFSKKLLYDEMVDIPLDRLLEIARADMRKNQGDYARIAREIEPGKEPRQVLAEIAADHPAPERLLQTFRDTLDGLVSFIREHHIVTIPSDVRPIVQDTPPFERATTFASMNSPGPFEQVAKEAYFNATVPDAKDSPQKSEGLMAQFNYQTIIATAVHETYPGHYLQFLWLPAAPSKVRKLLGAYTSVEGWAHYCEQMMLDEGYGQPGAGSTDVRRAKLLRLGQLQEALLRDARFIVGIEMHRGRMTFDQAVAFFAREGYQTREIGLVETKRGTSDPTYLYYTLGKLEILKLRADAQKKEGAGFSLQKFHDDLLRQGSPPLKIARKALLGDDSPVL